MKDDKVAEMPSKSTIRAVARKCPQVEEVLKGLFKEAFEEKEAEIKLEDGQIYKNNSLWDKGYYLLVKNGDDWKLVSVTILGTYWGNFRCSDNMKFTIQKDFTLCPNATIIVNKHEPWNPMPPSSGT